MNNLPQFKLPTDTDVVECTNPLADGVFAPGNSLIAASLESLSYQIAKQKQASHGKGPDIDAITKRLEEMANFLHMPLTPKLDLSTYEDIIRNDKDALRRKNALILASLKARTHAEQSFRGAIRSLTEEYFHGAVRSNPSFWADFLESVQLPVSVTETDRKYLLVVDMFFIEYLDADIPTLEEALLSPTATDTSIDSVPKRAFPGFRLVCQFRDTSTVTSSYYFDVECSTILQNVERSVSGTTALACINDTATNNGLFSVFSPPTQEEISAATNNNSTMAVLQERIASNLGIAQTLKSILTSGL